MPDWLQAVLAGLFGLGLIGGVFWFAFRRIPEKRSDAPSVSYDATDFSSGDGGGHG